MQTRCSKLKISVFCSRRRVSRGICKLTSMAYFTVDTSCARTASTRWKQFAFNVCEIKSLMNVCSLAPHPRPPIAFSLGRRALCAKPRCMRSVCCGGYTAESDRPWVGWVFVCCAVMRVWCDCGGGVAWCGVVWGGVGCGVVKFQCDMEQADVASRRPQGRFANSHRPDRPPRSCGPCSRLRHSRKLQRRRHYVKTRAGSQADESAPQSSRNGRGTVTAVAVSLCGVCVEANDREGMKETVSCSNVAIICTRSMGATPT